MARRKKRKKQREESEEEVRESWYAQLEPETKKGVFAIISFIIAALFVLSYIGQGGSAGGFLFRVFDFLLGRGYFFAPLMFVFIGFSLVFSHERQIVLPTVLGGILFLVTSLTGLTVLFGDATGGFAGSLLGTPLLSLFDFWASLVIVIGLFAISILLTFNMAPWQWFHAKTEGEAEAGGEVGDGQGVQSVLDQINSSIRATLDSVKSQDNSAESTQPAPQGSRTVIQEESEAEGKHAGELEKEESFISMRKVAKKWEYKKPPFELLQGDRGKPSSGDIRANANIIKRTLENFGIEVDMGEVSIGPTVTQYTLKPAEGVKLSRITALHNDLSLALAAHPLRIEAPIPGKSLVGIEVPNRSIATVGLRALFEHKLFQAGEKPLMFALGKDVSGNPVFADLARMPHMMIAGATGAGKSVCIHTLVSSFLYRNPPEVLRFIIVDPKRVELSVYNDIPHLLTPVITDPKKTVQALRWAIKEMDRRYDLLSQVHARDIASYNAQVSKKEGEDILPYIVIIIDELADLMATFPREVEASIIRLAQMARAIGIHIIVSTQRPSVEVITGLIKANITSRIAFQVASQIDSRTILDQAGAEKLLGNGDMLFLAGDAAHARRIQGAFISEQEVKRIVDFLREEVEAPEHDESILEAAVEEGGDSDGTEGGDDPLYEEARELVIQAQKASASYLQRRLRVGYARAARLLDILEENGVVGPADGAKPRDILVQATNDENPDVLES